MTRVLEVPNRIGRLIAGFCAVWMVASSTLVSAEVPKAALEKMASDEFTTRELGFSELKKWSMENLNASPEQLYKTWKNIADPEVKTRCFSLMKGAVIQRKFGRGKGFVGVRMEDVTIPGKPGDAGIIGVRITQVVPNTPAQKAGLTAGDVVIGVDEVDFNKMPKAQVQAGAVEVFSAYIQSKHPEDVITLHIMRGGKKIEKKVRLMLRPADADIDPFGGRMHENQADDTELFFDGWLKKMEG
ncbi:hypothetical protein NT6N_08830 [Oceaniferula spumae]|uniref:PDZ domain-containing protein n=1 Tax=Oceaniferula spumae TaxID=2979115 RepID=A0AAT9FIK8_9BACT